MAKCKAFTGSAVKGLKRWHGVKLAITAVYDYYDCAVTVLRNLERSFTCA